MLVVVSAQVTREKFSTQYWSSTSLVDTEDAFSGHVILYPWWNGRVMCVALPRTDPGLVDRRWNKDICSGSLLLYVGRLIFCDFIHDSERWLDLFLHVEKGLTVYV